MPTSHNNNIRGSGARQTKNTKHITHEGARSPKPPRKSKPPKR